MHSILHYFGGMVFEGVYAEERGPISFVVAYLIM